MFHNSEKTYIVAEIGGNFVDFDKGAELIDLAKECGVDAVKLQTYRAETITSTQAVFDMENTGKIPQTELFKKYELSEEIHRKLFQYAKKKGLDIFSTPSHISDVELLERLGSDLYKIGADDAVNIPFLKKVARLQKPIVLSTGMCTLGEIKEAVNAITEEGNSNIVIMHVVSLYPTAAAYVNLESVRTLQREFPQFTIGYSDHTLGVDSCIFAAVMGAKVIEKHFTYDKNADGPDHILSASKDEMRTMVSKIRLYEQMRGDGIKRPMGDEVKNRKNNRKSIVCTKEIKEGDVLTEKDVDIKRPGFGIPPKYLEAVIGRKALRDMEADSVICWSDVGF